MTSDLIKPSVDEGRYAAPTTNTERLLSQVLAEIMHVDRVTVDSHFFDDLGADSMVMARFCARVRKRASLPKLSMKKVYQYPTISSLATALVAPSPKPTTEQLFSEVLAGIMDVEEVPNDRHFFDDLGADSMMMARFCARVRKREDLPSVSMKDVYSYPTVSSLATALVEPSPKPTTEQLFSEILAEIMDVELVLADSHFFDDLGADSMMMARFCARVRKREDLPSVSMKEVYAHPTVNSLAGAFTKNTPISVTEPDQSLADEAKSIPALATTPVGTPRYLLCGTLQFLSVSAYLFVLTSILAQGYEWITVASGFVDIYLRSVLVGGGVFLGMSTLPILLKWLLIGRWQPQQIRIWSLQYFRFWFVKSLLRLNPLVLFAGAPIYVLYLRALGAKIGHGAVILSRHVPACADLLTIGDNTVIRKDSFFSCYRAHNGLIQTGSVTIGKNAYVGEKTVFDIESSLGDDAQLGHASSLNIGQAIPNGEHRHGSPARLQTDVDYQAVAPTFCGPLRKIAFSAFQLFNVLFILSVFFSVIILLAPTIAEWLYPLSPDASVFLQWSFYVNALIISTVLFFGSMLIALVFVGTVPRLLNRAIKPGMVYPLYGVHYWLQRLIARITNFKFFIHFFGDSSYIVHYLRWLGYDFSGGIVQTGSNFGSEVKHDNPFLVSVGPGTMIADGLSSINADYSTTSFKLSRVKIGANNFLGNHVAYPSQGKTGDNCLLATKVMVPIEGNVREGVGLLGSPSFEIPRSVMRDSNLDHPQSDEELGRQLSGKNKHNLGTMGLFLLAEWGLSCGLFLLIYGAANYYRTVGVAGYLLAALLALLFRISYKILVERAATLFRTLQPQECSIYNPGFWFHERYWKLAVLPKELSFLNGTPFKNLAWRLLGVQIGRRVFDDGCIITEKTMTAIGDNCTLNAGTIIQPHSQEDGGFKSDFITIGSGCTIGVKALVHYGVKMGDGAELAADTFLMKGEEVPPHTSWEENPAREVQDISSAELAMATAEPSMQAA